MTKAELLKKDFRITKGTDNDVYITPLVENLKRNKRLDSSTKMSSKHSFNDNITYSSNSGTLCVKSYYKPFESLLQEAIQYYNWAI